LVGNPLVIVSNMCCISDASVNILSDDDGIVVVLLILITEPLTELLTYNDKSMKSTYVALDILVGTTVVEAPPLHIILNDV